jgi:hypothetical protein
MQKEWMGKEVQVMPFLESPSEDVCVKTEVVKWLVVYSQSSNEELFRLDGSSKNMYGKAYVKDLYKRGVQWFEPKADNYLPLISISPKIISEAGIKHFSWADIAKFAEKDRWMISYRSGGEGDWKKSKDGGQGYILVTVEGVPYWGDAIGQIPFAVDYFTDRLEKSGDPKKAKEETIDKGKAFGNGKVIGVKVIIVIPMTTL